MPPLGAQRGRAKLEGRGAVPRHRQGGDEDGQGSSGDGRTDGVDVDGLVRLLVANAGAELTTFYDYTILGVNLIGVEGEGLKQIGETARIEDRNHFEALVPCRHMPRTPVPVQTLPHVRDAADAPPTAARDEAG